MKWESFYHQLFLGDKVRGHFCLMPNRQIFNDDRKILPNIFPVIFNWVKHVHMCACVYMFEGQSGNESGYPHV